MDVLGAIANVGSSAMSGGILGFAGSLVGGVFQYFQAKQEQAFKREEWGQEAALLRLNMEAAEANAGNERQLNAQNNSHKNLGKSITAESLIGESYKWVNAIRSLFRPFLTIGLFVLTYAFFRAFTKNGLNLTPETIAELVEYIVKGVVFCASTAGLWWFGERAISNSKLKSR